MEFWKFIGYSAEYVPTFTSATFVILFTIFYGVWSVTQRSIVLRNAVLLGFSLYFYYKLAGEWVVFLMVYAGIDYAIGYQMARERKDFSRRLLLYTSLLANFSILFVFKYLGFAIRVWNMGTGAELAVPEWVAPLGISFWIFRSLSYVLEVYYEFIEPERNYFYYLLYLSYFPMVQAGPIARAGGFLEQVHKPIEWKMETVSLGYGLILLGLCKKIILSDPLGANFVQRVFENPKFYTGLECLLAAFAYGFYLFYDFSGYTDMAVGMSLLLGISLPQNFNEPFKSQSITEFWRRWHITLLEWFQDFVFKPLNFFLRGWGKSGLVLSAMVTFLLSGIWHGANFTFIVWGLLHGIAIGYEILSKNFRNSLKNLWGAHFHAVLSVICTYAFLVFTFFFFNAPSLEEVGVMFHKIAYDFHPELLGKWLEAYQTVAYILIAGIIIHFLPTQWKKYIENQFVRLHWTLKILVIVFTVLVLYQFKTLGSVPFVYLQF